MFKNLIKYFIIFILSIWGLDYGIENIYRGFMISSSCKNISKSFSSERFFTKELSQKFLNDDDINQIINNCIYNNKYHATTLASNFPFHDYQQMYFTGELEQCIPKEIEKKIYKFANNMFCPRIGTTFKPAPSSQFSWWIMLYMKGQNIEPHHDTEALARDGWTMVLVLRSNGILIPQIFPNSTQTSIKGRIIHGIAHHNFRHHTPLLKYGNRTVLQLKGGPQTFDTPIMYLLRRIKSFAFMGLWTIIPPRYLIYVKDFGYLKYVSPLKIFPSVSPENQGKILRVIANGSNIVGNYTIYIWYIIASLFPSIFTSYKSFIKQIFILKILSILSFIPLIYDYVYITPITGLFFMIGSFLTSKSLYVLGPKKSYYYHEFHPLKKYQMITSFPYNFIAHPMIIGIIVCYTSLLLSVSDTFSKNIISGHIVSVLFVLAAEIFSN